MPMKTRKFSPRIVERLSLYRRLLAAEAAGGAQHIYSRQLAVMAGVSAEQVRQDMMTVGYNGTPVRGYAVVELANCIGRLLDTSHAQKAAIVGLGHLGRAITVYSAGRWPKLAIVAAFDTDPAKIGQIINGCACHPVTDLARIVSEQDIRIAIIAVPASEAQKIVEALIKAGVRGILNFAPVRLRVPPDVYVENMDVAVSLEKVAYFARQDSLEKSPDWATRRAGTLETGSENALQ
jgi:redox-sensing transcriptional repressor